MNKTYHIYECKYCGMSFVKEDWDEVGGFEEALMEHIRMDHPSTFKDIQSLGNPDLVTAAFEIKVFEEYHGYQRIEL